MSCRITARSGGARSFADNALGGFGCEGMELGVLRILGAAVIPHSAGNRGGNMIEVLVRNHLSRVENSSTSTGWKRSAGVLGAGA